MDQLSIHHLNTILKVSEAILALQKADDVLELINKYTCELLEAERSTLFLYDAKRNELYSKVTTQLEIHEIRIPLGKGVVGLVAQSKESLIIEDAYRDKRFNSEIDKLTGYITRNILTVPLVNRKHQLVGVFQVLNKKNGGFTSLDERVIQLFSSFVTIALENAFLYSQLDSAHQDLLRLDEMKHKFIGITSHELLTPITILMGQLDLICHELLFPLTEEQKSSFTILKEQVLLLTQRVRDIINVSELEYQVRSVHYEAIDLHQLFVSIEKETGLQAQERSQSLQFVSHTLRSDFYGDEEKLRQAVINIIMNAIRFTPDHGEITVTLDTITLKKYSDQDYFLQIRVQDTGIGIPEEEFQRIFMTFYEVKDIKYHSSGTYEYQSSGLGLGLPIAKKIVEKHQGWIEIESKPQQGSVFTIFLPYNTDHFKQQKEEIYEAKKE